MMTYAERRKVNRRSRARCKRRATEFFTKCKRHRERDRALQAIYRSVGR